MKSIEDRRKEVIHHLWNNANHNPRSSTVFHKFLEELIKRDRQELLAEITAEVVQKCDSYSDCMNVLTEFKIK